MDAISQKDKTQAPERLKRRSRPLRVTDAIKELMIENGMVAGDRLPSEIEMIESFGMSKGTIREAMRILETQGLIETKTGPGGGSFIKQVSHERARALLGNYFYFKDLSIGDIYQLRVMLEPELAASLAGKLPAHAIEKLEQDIARYSSPANTLEEERDHHINSLRFHIRLAHYADNVLLGFLIDFMASILSDITVNRHLYDPPNLDLWRKGIDSQRRLLAALRDGDSENARAIMAEHMTYARRLMQNQENHVLKKFMTES